MNALWIAVWLLVLAWLGVLEVFTPYQRPLPWVLPLAVLAAAWGLRRVEVPRRGGWALAGLVTAAAAAFVLPAPFRTGFALAAAGAGLLLAAGRWRLLDRLALALAAVGVVWALQAALVPVVYHLASRYHRVDGLSPLVYLMLKPFFEPMALSGGDLYIPRAQQVFRAITSWERLGLLPAMLFAGGGVAALLYARSRLERVALFLTSLVFYLLVRYAVMVGIEVSTASASQYWDSVLLALSFLPFALFAMAAFPLSPPTAREGAPPRGLDLRAGALALAGAALLVAGVAWNDPGERKPGRLLIDEFHSDWEWTTEAFDTEWYGGRSGYNYYSLGRFLRYHYQVETLHEPLTAERLARCDILLLKTPTRPFAPGEVAAIEAFVRAGGGLLLVGDHTNVFGTSTYMNPVATRFGLRFVHDSTYDLASMGLSLYRPPRVFRHPVVLHLPPYLFATSCSLTAPFFSEAMIIGYGLKSMDADYSQVSFFPENKSVTHYLFGLFLQAAGVRYGKGRVLGYTDSTCFSNFFMFIPGKPELMLGMLDWVNRTNRRRGLNALLLVLGAGLLLAALARGARRGFSGALALAVGATWGFLTAAWVCHALAERDYPEPRPHTPMPTVAFESEHSRFDLPVYSLTREAERSLQTFFVWVQRLDLFPRLYPSLEQALRAGGPVVIANPGEPFTTTELDSVAHFVRRGGHLLVLDDPRNLQSSTDQLLGIFNMRRDTLVAGPAPMTNPQGAIIGSTRWAGGVRGGRALGFVDDTVVVVAEQPFERGRVTVYMNSFAFTDAVMGATGVNPDAVQRQLYEIEYWLLRRMISPEPDLERLAPVAEAGTLPPGRAGPPAFRPLEPAAPGHVHQHR